MKETSEILQPDTWYELTYPKEQSTYEMYDSRLGSGNPPLWPEFSIIKYAEYYHAERKRIEAPTDEEIITISLDNCDYDESAETNFRYGMEHMRKLLTGL